MKNEIFAGNQAQGQALTTRFELSFRKKVVPYLPLWLRSHHLTLATIPISGLLVVFGYWAQSSPVWLWGAIVLIALQWITDTFDGELGRYRQEGLVRWGYYMDHLLDFIFLGAVFAMFGFLLPSELLMVYFALFVIMASYMVSAFLQFAATNKFQIYYFFVGPTELRLIAIMACLAVMAWGNSVLVEILYPAVGLGLAGLIALVYQVQRLIRIQFDGIKRLK